jgi:hypothetical protein
MHKVCGIGRPTIWTANSQVWILNHGTTRPTENGVGVCCCHNYSNEYGHGLVQALVVVAVQVPHVTLPKDGEYGVYKAIVTATTPPGHIGVAVHVVQLVAPTSLAYVPASHGVHRAEVSPTQHYQIWSRSCAAIRTSLSFARWAWGTCCCRT